MDNEPGMDVNVYATTSSFGERPLTIKVNRLGTGTVAIDLGRVTFFVDGFPAAFRLTQDLADAVALARAAHVAESLAGSITP